LIRTVKQGNHRFDAFFLRRGQSIADLLPQDVFARRVEAPAAADGAMVHQ
jgi:hypothetical protein